MSLPLLLAKRYLIAKKSHNAINVISMVSVCGVAVITMALICTLSVYNGFQNLIATLYSSFDPDLQIEPVKGKTFVADSRLFSQLRSRPEIDVYSEVLEETVLVSYNGRQIPALMKGVENNFEQLTNIDSILVSGRFLLNDSVVDYATLGVGLASQLGVNAGFVSPLEIFVPRADARVNLANPVDAFNQGALFVGGVFAVNQIQYDDQVMLAPLDFARRMFGSPNSVSKLELKLKPGVNAEAFQREVQSLLGASFRVLNRMQQQAESFRIMEIEKWMTFLILLFILLIAIFNVIGSLSMLIMDKKTDIDTLRNLGADDSFIRRVFLFEGCLISGFGALVGILLGVGLCLAQQYFGLLRLGDANGMFIVDAYPVRLLASDMIWVLLAVSLLGYLAALYPVRTLLKRYMRKD